MDWTAQLDGYCERLGPGLWAEPWNLVTNAGFLVAAILMARRCRGMAGGEALALILFVIGIGSALFHSYATGWAMLADTGPIGIFILAYLFLASRDFLGLAPARAALATAAFLPYAAITVPLFQRVPGLGSSAGYAPVPVLIFFYAWLLRHRAPRHRARHGGGRRAPRRLADPADHRPAALPALAARHPFPLAPPERRAAGLDDRGLAPAPA